MTVRPPGGWLKSARLNGITVLAENGSFSHTNNYSYSKYALTFPGGYRQKVLHSRGTKEVSFQVSGDLTYSGGGIANFLHAYYRGLIFPVAMSQGGSALGVASGMMESFSLTGSADGTVKYSLSGKSLSDYVAIAPWVVTDYEDAVPAWNTGNTNVRSWTITHTTSLQAKWFNTQSALPAYYRPGESEYSMQITTMLAMQEYDTISIGVGSFAIIQGLVTQRSVQFSGREPITYEVSVTNVNLSNNPLTAGAVVG